MKRPRIIAGILIWLVLVGVGIWIMKYRATKANDQAIRQLVDYAKGPNQFVKLTSDEPVKMAINDPLFMVDEAGEYQRIGEIESIELVEGKPRYISMNSGKLLNNYGYVQHSVAKFYNAAPDVTDSCSITMHETPASLEWIINEMTKDGAWDEYERKLALAVKEHSDEIMEEFRPVLEAALRDSAVVVAKDLKAAFEKRRERIELISKRYENDLLKEKFLPLIQEEILPIVQQRAEPTLDEVGSEIWKRASLWRFSWRLAYDKMPLPKRDLARKEWERFVDDEILPVLEAHIDDFIEVQKEIVTDISKNEKVRSVLKESALEIVNDPEVRKIFEEIMIEVFVENPRLHEVIRKHLESEQTQRTLSLAADRFQETMREISEDMFGTPQTQITPGFARVLRNQVLRKDSRWFVVHYPDPTATAGQISREKTFSIGETGNENPFVKASEIPAPKILPAYEDYD